MKATWLDRSGEIDAATLRRNGVHHERLATDGYQPALEALKSARGYIEQDVIELSPETPGLDEICARFDREHLHTEDEVRFVLAGEGIFDIRSDDDAWMRVAVEAGDLIVVPANRHHRFLLTPVRAIRCVRLFQDRGGWVPHYRS